MGEHGQAVSGEVAVARCAIHPRYLNPKGGPFEPKYLLDLKRVPKESMDFKTSVGTRELLVTDADVHEYGCSSAAISNSERAKLGKEITPTKNAAHYLGFYNVQVSELAEQSNEVYSVHVEYWPEHGQEAHCHIVLQERSDLTDEQTKLKSHHRTNIIEGIWDAMMGPVRHLCECDQDHELFLSSLDLPNPQQVQGT